MTKTPSALESKSNKAVKPTYNKCVLVRVRDKSGKLLGYVAEPEKTHQYGDLGMCKPWYQITCNEQTGRWNCTCPARKPCKHIKAAQELNEIRLGVCKVEAARVPKSVQSVPALCPENVQNAPIERPVEGDKDLPEEDRRYITIVPAAPLVIDDGDGRSIYEEFSEENAQRWVQEELSSERLTREQYDMLFDPNYLCCA